VKVPGAFVAAGTLRAGDMLEWHRRASFGRSEISQLDIAEAALAGWMQSDGFVGQYTGTNSSLTMEALTVTPAEFAWVGQALDTVFPDVHRKVRDFATQSKLLDGKRIRPLRQCTGRTSSSGGTFGRGAVDMEVPAQLFEAAVAGRGCISAQHLSGRGLCIRASTLDSARGGHDSGEAGAGPAVAAAPVRDLCQGRFQD
jgi:hypothetical protein